jgi:Flp pilus assembly protein TadD
MVETARRLLVSLALAVAVAIPSVARAEPSWATEHAAELTHLGQAEVARGESSAAARRFLEAISTDPTYGPVYLALGSLYESTGEVKEAERAYAMGIEHVVGFARVRVARAHLLAALHRMPEAVADLEVAVAEEPDDAALLDELARAYVTTGAMPAALAATRRLALLDDRRADVHGAQGARLKLKALELLVADLDPVIAGRRGRGPVRQAIAFGTSRAH